MGNNVRLQRHLLFHPDPLLQLAFPRHRFSDVLENSVYLSLTYLARLRFSLKHEAVFRITHLKRLGYVINVIFKNGQSLFQSKRKKQWG